VAVRIERTDTKRTQKDYQSITWRLIVDQSA
jgi:hypothetical protein